MCSVSDVKTSPYCAPSILITFINMVLFNENTAPEVCDKYMYGGQVSIYVILPM
jgi:V-type H+-transporting ATPase subunit a